MSARGATVPPVRSLPIAVRPHRPRAASAMLVSGLSVAVGVVAWALASRALDSQLFPSPKAILDAALDMTRNGMLFADIAVSLRRIGIGFALGCLVGIPLGLAMGLFRFARALRSESSSCASCRRSRG